MRPCSTGKSDGEGERNPGGDVVERSSRHGGLPDMRGEELELGQDACQDREGRDGEGHRHEEQVGGEAHLVGALNFPAEYERHPDAEHEGGQDPRRRDGCGSPPAPPYGAEVELQPNQEEEEEEAETRHRFKNRRAPFRENPVHVFFIPPK